MSAGRWTTVATVAAALWGLAFAGLHLLWALGGRLLIADATAADAAFTRTWFQVYNASVAVASVGVAALAITALRCPSPRYRRVARRLLWLPAGALLLRAGVGVVQLTTAVVTGSGAPLLAAWRIDLIMLAGGAILAGAARGHGRGAVTRPTGSEPTRVSR